MIAYECKEETDIKKKALPCVRACGWCAGMNTTLTTSNHYYLLTPGPLTTSQATKEAMLRDWGSRDTDFIALTAQIRTRLVELAGAAGSHVCIPLQGSGTFAVEAALGTLTSRTSKTLVLVNGAYGQRMCNMLTVMGREYVKHEVNEDQPTDVDALDAALASDPSLTHVAAVYCETTSGILNPIERIAHVVAKHGRKLLIDAMSAFGALPLNAQTTPFDAVMASSNKCLEGVPGMGFVIVRESTLRACEGNAHSLSLDLYNQWQGLEKTGQWRFTPPTHVLAAFVQALGEHAEEGGVAGRYARYSDNCRILIEGMHQLGFTTLLPESLQAPIIVTFHMPTHPNFHFATFYEALRQHGFVIYPGKLTVADSFRIGCIGHLFAEQMHGALKAISDVLGEMQCALKN